MQRSCDDRRTAVLHRPAGVGVLPRQARVVVLPRQDPRGVRVEPEAIASSYPPSRESAFSMEVC
jgi:hypothetical protein